MSFTLQLINLPVSPIPPVSVTVTRSYLNCALGLTHSSSACVISFDLLNKPSVIIPSLQIQKPETHRLSLAQDHSMRTHGFPRYALPLIFSIPMMACTRYARDSCQKPENIFDAASFPSPCFINGQIPSSLSPKQPFLSPALDHQLSRHYPPWDDKVKVKPFSHV